MSNTLCVCVCVCVWCFFFAVWLKLRGLSQILLVCFLVVLGFFFCLILYIITLVNKVHESTQYITGTLVNTLHWPTHYISQPPPSTLELDPSRF